MGKRLLIVWDGKTLHDDEVDEIVWSDGAGGVSVQGKLKRPTTNSGSGGGLLDMLTSARKQQAAKEVEARKAALAAENEVETVFPPESEIVG